MEFSKELWECVEYEALFSKVKIILILLNATWEVTNSNTKIKQYAFESYNGSVTKICHIYREREFNDKANKLSKESLSIKEGTLSTQELKKEFSLNLFG
jgi:hypothetical protein